MFFFKKKRLKKNFLNYGFCGKKCLNSPSVFNVSKTRYQYVPSVYWITVRSTRILCMDVEILPLQGNFKEGHMTSVPIHSRHSSADSVTRQTASMERLAFRWSVPSPPKKKGQKESEEGEKILKICSFTPLVKKAASFWTELDRLPLVQEDPPSQQPYTLPGLTRVTLLKLLRSALHKKEEIERY